MCVPFSIKFLRTICDTRLQKNIKSRLGYVLFTWVLADVACSRRSDAKNGEEKKATGLGRGRVAPPLSERLEQAKLM